MPQSATQAYQQTAKKTVSPRELESTLLSRAASNFVRIRDNWENGEPELGAALEFNKRLWSVLVASVTSDDNPLPREIRQNVANLGIFILGQTVELELRPQRAKLDTLININRELATGLRNAANAA